MPANVPAATTARKQLAIHPGAGDPLRRDPQERVVTGFQRIVFIGDPELPAEAASDPIGLMNDSRNLVELLQHDRPPERRGKALRCAVGRIAP
jgi:hypothetical protein